MQPRSTKIQLFADRPSSTNIHRTLTFFIHRNKKLLITVEMDEQHCVGQLVVRIKEKLAEIQQQVADILCFQSNENDQVLDYSLLIDDYPLASYVNFVDLAIVYKKKCFSQFSISLNDFYFKKCIGQGASANVYLVRHKVSGKLYALKQIAKQYFSEFKRMEQVLREKTIMMQFLSDCPFIAKLIATFQSQSHLNFLLEFYPGGEMFFHLQGKRLSENQAQIYFAELVLTFEYLHSCNIIYRDLKPQNILIDLYGHTKLTDFGLCKINCGKDDLTTSYCGSIQYMAPEVKESIGYSYSVDFYTLGAFLYEMVIGVPPYYNSYSLFFRNSSIEFEKLVRGLVEEKIEDRVSSFEFIKRSKFMKDIDWQQIKEKRCKMAFQVKLGKTYIHQQFRQVDVEQKNLYNYQNFERLFDGFSYINCNDEQFAKCYRMQDAKNHKSVQSRLELARAKSSSNLQNALNKTKNSDHKVTKQQVEDISAVNQSLNKTKTLSRYKSAKDLLKFVLGA